MICSPNVVIMHLAISLGKQNKKKTKKKLSKHNRNISKMYLIHETARHILIDTCI